MIDLTKKTYEQTYSILCTHPLLDDPADLWYGHTVSGVVADIRAALLDAPDIDQCVIIDLCPVGVGEWELTIYIGRTDFPLRENNDDVVTVLIRRDIELHHIDSWRLIIYGHPNAGFPAIINPTQPDIADFNTVDGMLEKYFAVYQRLGGIMYLDIIEYTGDEGWQVVRRVEESDLIIAREIWAGRNRRLSEGRVIVDDIKPWTKGEL